MLHRDRVEWTRVPPRVSPPYATVCGRGAGTRCLAHVFGLRVRVWRVDVAGVRMVSGERGCVLVTGGAGYIGSHACKALAGAGYLPVAYDTLSTGNRWAVRWGPLERGDVCDGARLGAVLARWRPVAAMHFAALSLVGDSVRDPALYYRVNVGGAITLLDALRAAGIGRLVFSSTCAVYGAPDRLPIDEATPCRPLNPYGQSKLMVERILADHGTAYGLAHVILRYFNAAGADPAGEIGERRGVETHLVPLAIEAAAGRAAPLQVFGTDYATPDGTAVRDYIHVTDLAEAHVRALGYLQAGGTSRTLNLGTGQGYSVRAVLDRVARAAGRPVPHDTAPRRTGDAPELVADPAAARALLGADLTRHSDLSTIVETAWRWHGTPDPLPMAAAAPPPGSVVVHDAPSATPATVASATPATVASATHAVVASASPVAVASADGMVRRADQSA